MRAAMIFPGETELHIGMNTWSDHRHRENQSEHVKSSAVECEKFHTWPSFL